MPGSKGIALSEGALAGLYFIQRYRFLTIAQFAKVTGFSNYHAAELLRRLTKLNACGYFGGVFLPGSGKTPKVYFLKRRGFAYLLTETDFPPEKVGEFVEVNQELTWTPQMYHRLRLLDLFLALEMQVRGLSHLDLVETRIEYRRVKGTYLRETTDFVTDAWAAEDRIVPDGAFILENQETGRRGLFFVEMDMGTERITAPKSIDKRATIRGKFEQYDRYLLSGRFARTYAPWGEFRSFTLLFVTPGSERIENIRAAVADLPARLHAYYRLTTFQEAITNFLGFIWKSRDRGDTVSYALVQTEE
jgi:hypothetical protein